MSAPVTQTEPVAVGGVITAAVGSTLAVGAAFGLPITDEQSAAILTCIPAYVALVGVMTALVRSKVYSPATVGRMLDAGASPDDYDGTPDTR